MATQDPGMTSADVTAPPPLGAAAYHRYTKIRFWTWVTVLWVTALYLLVINVASSLVHYRSLYAWLGESLYNATVPGRGLSPVIRWGPVPLAVDLALWLAWRLWLTVGRALDRRIGRATAQLGATAVVAVTAWLPIWSWQRFVIDDPRSMVLAARTPGFETEYAPGYSAFGFSSIEPGMTRQQVVARIGPPLDEAHRDVFWQANFTWPGEPPQTFFVRFDEQGRATRIGLKAEHDLALGMTREQLTDRLGQPLEERHDVAHDRARYARGPQGYSSHWIREVRYDTSGHVISVEADVWFD